MPLEKQLSSQELSKKLEQLGVKQESLFYWVNDGKELGEESDRWVCVYKTWTNPENPTKPDKLSAFTSSELGEMLPEWTKIYFTGEHWDCESGDVHYKADTMVDSMAKMLIHLIEQEIIKI